MQRENSACFDDETINIYDIVLAIKNRKWIAIIIATLIFICFGIYSILSPDVYQASNVLIINQANEDPSNEYQLRINERINDMGKIKSILSELIEMPKLEQANLLSLKGSSMGLVKAIKVTKIEQTSSLKIAIDIFDRGAATPTIKTIVDYVNKLPYIQKKLAQRKEIARKNINELKNIMDNPANYLKLPNNIMLSEIMVSMYKVREKSNELTILIDALEKGEFVQLANNTYVPNQPYKPKRLKIAIIGLAAGAFLGLFAAFMSEWIYSARREYENS